MIVNRYVRQFKTAFERRKDLGPEYKVIIRSDRIPVGEHARTFNAPTTDEVAVLLAAPDLATKGRDVVVEWQTGGLKRMNELNPAYDPLQYPLLFPHGTDGYRLDIPQFNTATGRLHETKKVTCKEFYSYLLHLRQQTCDALHRSRHLLNQFVVDMYAKVTLTCLFEYFAFVIILLPHVCAVVSLHLYISVQLSNDF